VTGKRDRKLLNRWGQPEASIVTEVDWKHSMYQEQLIMVGILMVHLADELSVMLGTSMMELEK
jgi:hypothetical protein